MQRRVIQYRYIISISDNVNTLTCAIFIDFSLHCSLILRASIADVFLIGQYLNESVVFAHKFQDKAGDT
jgi:hypothetical protein